jgi:hypothetical protein
MVIKNKLTAKQSQRVHVSINIGKRKKQKKKATKKPQPQQISGFTGRNYFAVQNSNPFPQLIENRMSSMQQNMSNSINNTLQTITAENNVLRERLRKLEYEIEQESEDRLRALSLRQQRDRMTEQIERREELRERTLSDAMRAEQHMDETMTKSKESSTGFGSFIAGIFGGAKKEPEVEPDRADLEQEVEQIEQDLEPTVRRRRRGKLSEENPPRHSERVAEIRRRNAQRGNLVNF